MAARHASMEKREKNIEEIAVPVFLGEIVIAKCNVLKYSKISTNSSGVLGTLYITNFKVAFTCSSCLSDNEKSNGNSGVVTGISCSEDYDDDIIPITAIKAIYVISTKADKRKRLKSNTKRQVSNHYDQLEIETKDLRSITYDFKNSLISDRRTCFSTILHYAFPRNLNCLFAFDYGQNMRKSSIETQGRAFCLFRHIKDYEMNLSRLRCAEFWRVASVNREYEISQEMPKYFVCPASVDDVDCGAFAKLYNGRKMPMWLWTDPTSGVSLLLSSNIKNTIKKTPSTKSLSKEKNGFIDYSSFSRKSNSIVVVSKSHPQKFIDSISSCQSKEGSGRTTTINVDYQCPTLQELQGSYEKIFKSCLIKSSKDYFNSDTNWLATIEESQWLHYASICLRLSCEAVSTIKERHVSVIILDENGSDFSMVVSSLAQISLDPYYRTVIGLQALIQKDWVVKGHPFRTRLGHIFPRAPKKHAADTNKKTPTVDTKEEEDENESPLFILFLDCLHQLMRQYPTKFEYTEQFLILLIDCAYSALFETFIFDNDSENSTVASSNRLISAWDFIATNIPEVKFNMVFVNGAFKFSDDVSCLNDKISCSSVTSFDYNAGIEVIYPDHLIMNLHFWSSYFYRWIDTTDLSKGFGAESMLKLQQQHILEEVQYLESRVIRLQDSLSDRKFLSPGGTNSLKSVGKKGRPFGRGHYLTNEEFKEEYLNLICGLYFLKML